MFILILLALMCTLRLHSPTKHSRGIHFDTDWIHQRTALNSDSSHLVDTLSMNYMKAAFCSLDRLELLFTFKVFNVIYESREWHIFLYSVVGCIACSLFCISIWRFLPLKIWWQMLYNFSSASVPIYASCCFCSPREFYAGSLRSSRQTSFPTNCETDW